MANLATIKAEINQYITTNGVNAITGDILNDVLNDIVTTLGAGYAFLGVADPNTSPSTPDCNAFYIAVAGTYTAFGSSYTVPVGSIGVFSWNGSWAHDKIQLFAGIDEVPSEGSDNLVKSGGVFSTVNSVRRSFTREADSPRQLTRYDVYDFKPNTVYSAEINLGTFPSINNSEWLFQIVASANGSTSTLVTANYSLSQKPARKLYFMTPSSFDFIRIGMRYAYDYAVTIEEVSQNGCEFNIDYSPTATTYPIYCKIYNGERVRVRINCELSYTLPTSSTNGIRIYTGNGSSFSLVKDIELLLCRHNEYEFTADADFLKIEILADYSMNVNIGVENLYYLRTDAYQEKNILPLISRADGNFVVNATPSENMFGLFHQAKSATVIDGEYVRVITTNSSPSTIYSGIRTNFLLSNPLVANKNVTLKFKYRTDPNYAGRFVFFVQSGVQIILPLSADWSYFERSFYVDSSYDRIQFAYRKDEMTADNLFFDVKDISLAVENEQSDQWNIRQLWSNFDNMFLARRFAGKKISIMGDSISTASGFNAVELEILDSDIANGRTLQAYPTYFDIGTTIGGITVDAGMVGVLTSFTPVSGDAGKKIGVPANYNSFGRDGLWWQKMADSIGATILQNVSWSGASISSHEGDEENYKTSYAWHDAQINKLATRDADGNSVTPDVVIIYRGTNDLSHSPYSILTDFGAGSTAIPPTDVVSGGFGFKEAYALTISKIRAKYPEAFVICCTLNIFKRVIYDHFPTRNGTNTLPEFNNAIRDVAAQMGCGIIELDKDGITFENCYPTYISDSSTIPTHPNLTGHERMSRKAILDITKCNV